MLDSIISSPRQSLSLQQVLNLANVYLENACTSTDPDIVLVLCHDTEASLSLIERATKNTDDIAIHKDIAAVYAGLGDLLSNQGHHEEAQAFYQKSEEWGGLPYDQSRPKHHSRSTCTAQSAKSTPHSSTDRQFVQSPRSPASPHKQGIHSATLPQDIFPANVRPPTIDFRPPEPNTHLMDTFQLAFCLSLLQACEPHDIVDLATRKLLDATHDDPDEQERLKVLAADVVRAFKKDNIKDPRTVTEGVYLDSVLGNGDFRHLLKESQSWVDRSGLLDIHQLLRETCTRVQNGGQYQFIHRPLLEYGLALGIFDPEDWKEDLAPESALVYRESATSALSSDELDHADDHPPITKQEPDPESPLTWRSFTNDLPLLRFLEERVQQEPLFKQQLLDYIEHSKTDERWCTAAANAITILVRAGVQFNSADLRGIRIPKADLSYGMFDSAQLQGADLRQVNFLGSWLRQADLTNALMTDVQFGELPSLKHDARVRMSVYSPDGKSLAVGFYHGGIIVYSTSTWKLRWALIGHSSNITSIKYSSNGYRLASGSGDMTLRLWDTETDTCLHILRGHEGSITRIAFSPHGNQLVSASDDCTVRLWDVETGRCLCQLVGHTQMVNHVAFSPDGNQIASCSTDTAVRLWSIEPEVYPHTLRGHNNGAVMVEYSPNGEQLATASIDFTVRLWDVAAGECRYVLDGHEDSVILVKYSPKGDQVASASWDFTVRLWDIDTGVCLYTFLGPGNWIGIAYSPHGDILASTCNDMTVWLWDTDTGVCRQILEGHSESIPDVTFSPKGDQIASSGHDATVRLWDVGTGTSRYTLHNHDLIYDIKYSPKGNHIASCNGDNTVRLLDVETGACLDVLRGHIEGVYCVAYSPQGNYIASGSWDQTVRLWNVEAEHVCTHTLVGHVGDIIAVAFSPQGGLLASVGQDTTVRLWEVDTGECRFTYQGHTDDVYEAVFSPNGNQIATCSDDFTARLWNVETGVCDHILAGHFDDVVIVRYSPRGDQVASSGGDCTVRFWDTRTGECQRILIGHTSDILFITYSPQGDQLASGSKDKTIRLWDLGSGNCVRTLVGHHRTVRRMVYSPQADLIASVATDRSVRIWDVVSGQCRAALEDFRGTVNEIEWVVISDVHHLVTGCRGGKVELWRLVNDGDQCQVSLVWNSDSISRSLNVNRTAIQDVRGLSSANKRLLKQRGAVGEPANRLREVEAPPSKTV